MARILLRLRLRLLANTLRRGMQAALGLIVGLLFALGGGALAAAWLAVSSHTAIWSDLVVVVAALVWVGWLFLPLLSFSSDDTLDPRKFALFGLRPGALVPGLLLGALVGLGTLATVLGASGAVLGTWRETGAVAPTAVAALAVVLFVLACVATSRALLTWAADLLASRRGRDFATLLGVVVLVAFVAAGQVLPRVAEFVSPALLHGAATFLRWTPGGWAGAAMVDAAGGRPGVALLWLLALAIWIVAMLGLWARGIARIRTTTPSRSHATTGTAGLYPRALAWLPRTRTTAVAVRFLRSLVRDPRVRNQALSQSFIVVPMLAISVGTAGGASAPLLATFVVVPFGLIAANQFGLDGPALWQHRLAGADPRSDLLGRDLALAVLAVPVAAVAAIVLAAVFSAWSLLPAALLLALATLLVLLGVSNAAAVIMPFPVPEDVSNPFAANSGSPGTGCLQGLFVLVTLLTHGVMSLPVVLAATVPDTATVRALAAAFAVVYGAAVLAGGTSLGVSRARGRGPEILAAVEPRAQ